MNWNQAQKEESAWWTSCTNTYQEETKQRDMIAPRLGLAAESINGHWPVYNLQGKSVLDIGSGPVSLLLKCTHYTNSAVLDPCGYPYWVSERYQSAGLKFYHTQAEKFTEGNFDEVWIYNVLQHVVNPELVIRNALKIGRLIRLVEYIDVPTDGMHLHCLRAQTLNKWLNGQGKTEYLPAYNASVYFGIFSTQECIFNVLCQ